MSNFFKPSIKKQAQDAYCRYYNTIIEELETHGSFNDTCLLWFSLMLHWGKNDFKNYVRCDEEEIKKNFDELLYELATENDFFELKKYNRILF